MRIASIPFSEESKYLDLARVDILDSEAEKEFDHLLELASDICRCPIAAISFLDSKQQWFKSKIGMKDFQIPSNNAFCAHTILQNEVLEVKDATLDERFSNNPLVTDELFIRFYAGAPIVSATGYNIGSVCVIDQEPKALTPEQCKVLMILSQQVSKLLELRITNKVLKKQSEEQIKNEKLLLLKTLQEQEVERHSISSELHENIAQCLAATKFYLEIAEESDNNKNELIRKSKNMMTNLVQQVQDLSKSIRPTTLKELYLQESLIYLLKAFEKKTSVVAQLLYEGNPILDPDLAMTVYRIVEDQLDNIRQHSRASKVIVNVNNCQSLFISIKDNGIGVDLMKFKKGVGINKVLSRVESFNGTIYISGGFNRGCELIITVPLHVPEKKRLAEMIY